MRRLSKHLAGHDTMRAAPTLMVTTTGGVIRIDLAEIDWIEAAGNYARIWTGARSFLLRESLQRLAERLERSGFCRAHRRALIRVDGVRRLARTGDGGLVAVLGTGVRIPISRRLRAAVIERVQTSAQGMPPN
jgi:two-component system, LytTR family, response regulator